MRLIGSLHESHSFLSDFNKSLQKIIPYFLSFVKFLLTKYPFLCKIETLKMSTIADKKYRTNFSCYFVKEMV